MKRRDNSVLLDVQKGQRASTAALRLKRLARRYLATLKLNGCELSLLVVSDRRIRDLNRQFRDKDTATDVLSFPGGETVGPGPRLLGDVVISIDTARRMARALGTSVRHELALYLAHGVLHLLGHDHHEANQARVMRRLEAKLVGGEGMLARSAK